MVYNLCANMVTGDAYISFSGELFFHGILFFAPIVVIFIGMFLVLSMIRHNIHSISAMVVYGVLLLLSWLFIIPMGNNYILALESYESENLRNTQLSPGFFRSYGDDSVYFSGVTDNELYSGVLISSADDTMYTFKDMTVESIDEQFFADTLVQSNVDMPVFMNSLVEMYKIFYEISKSASLAGIGSWLCFATIGLALISVIALKDISHYRLVNALLVLYCSLIIVVFNIFGYQPSFISPLVDGANNFLRKLIVLRNISNPFVMLCNILFAMILCGVGVYSYFREGRNYIYSSNFISSDEEGDDNL